MNAAVCEVVLDWPGVTVTKMFGRPTYQADGTLFVVLSAGAVAMTRHPAEHRRAVERAFTASPFDAAGPSCDDVGWRSPRSPLRNWAHWSSTFGRIREAREESR